MSKESTNVELEPIEVVGGEIITDTQRETQIPPKGQLKIESPENEETVTIKLGGKWPPEKDEVGTDNKEEAVRE